MKKVSKQLYSTYVGYTVGRQEVRWTRAHLTSYLPTAIHLYLANDTAFFSLRWHFLLILPHFCLVALKFFV